TKAYWADSKGNRINRSGFKHTVYMHIETEGLSGEKIRLNVWESEPGHDTRVKKDGPEIEITATNGTINQAFKLPDTHPTPELDGESEFFFTIEKFHCQVEGATQDPEAGNEYTLIKGKAKYLYVNSDKKIVSLKVYESNGDLHTGIVAYGDTVTIRVNTRNYIKEEITFMLRESVSGFDKKLSETLNLKIDQEGYGETTFTIPTNASWEGAHEKGKEGVPRYFYFKEVKSGAEFPRAYYVANQNKADEADKINSKGNRITAL
ncbi:hypothetical protein, partial [Mariniflexile ostreae]